MAEQQAKHEALRKHNRQRLQHLQRPFEFDSRVTALLAAKRALALQPVIGKYPSPAAPRTPSGGRVRSRKAALQVRLCCKYRLRTCYACELAAPLYSFLLIACPQSSGGGTVVVCNALHAVT